MDGERAGDSVRDENPENGVTDHLRIGAWLFVEKTVAAIHCQRFSAPFVILIHQYAVHNARVGIISPDLVGPAVVQGIFRLRRSI